MYAEDVNAAHKAGLGNTRWCVRSAALDYFSQAEGCIESLRDLEDSQSRLDMESFHSVVRSALDLSPS